MAKRIHCQLVETSADFQQAQVILREYLETLGSDLAYLNLPAEFATLSWRYAAPEGALLLAFGWP